MVEAASKLVLSCHGLMEKRFCMINLRLPVMHPVSRPC